MTHRCFILKVNLFVAWIWWTLCMLVVLCGFLPILFRIIRHQLAHHTFVIACVMHYFCVSIISGVFDMSTGNCFSAQFACSFHAHFAWHSQSCGCVRFALRVALSHMFPDVFVCICEFRRIHWSAFPQRGFIGLLDVLLMLVVFLAQVFFEPRTCELHGRWRLL